MYKAFKYKVVVELNCHIGTYGSLKRKGKKKKKNNCTAKESFTLILLKRI